MYKPNFDFTDAGTDIERLDRFLVELENFLTDVVKTGEDSRGTKLILKRLMPAMQNAWNAVGESPANQATARFANLRNRLKDTSSQTREDHGLTGSSLKFKLDVISHWTGVYNLFGGSRWFEKIIDLIDTLFESLIDAVGAGGALAELKDFILGCVDERA
ncbi:hypothetical protein ACSBOB_18420 [Mesorhizobium sp. ASY16-5R]|uniref:hypothetical protein n=1 Tax=Mesorhizobium sp. ASY16-5R TaxID=3445772 RepID=UPI003FA04DA5